MWHRTFADVLDDALGVTAGPVSCASRGASNATRQPADPFLFVRMPVPAGARVTYATASSAMAMGGGQNVATGPAPAGQHRPVRILNLLHQRALDLLNTNGAHLRADFTSDELRRAYRLLARCIHPDRHPHVAAAERGRLTRAFADISEAYRRLLLLVDPTH